ncbi:extracellular calcium-sensing receptor-like [Stylophora pistillata]|uniref:extracellular calcium-sensing receptor-like n=1 Tax=Stylophora pistillata TaxID=50429 RepID=UPI000C0545BF|nr:extracellular calcium-sensing receptor-like [Stylophora pistillata]
MKPFLFVFWFLLLVTTLSKGHSAGINHTHHCEYPRRISNLEADLIVGGLFPVHVVQPTGKGTHQEYDINLYGVNWIEAMLFTIKEINNDPRFFPLNFTLGFDIKDSCNDVPVALKATLDFVLDTGNTTTDKNISKNCSTRYCKCTDKQTLISAVIGAASSAISTNVANLLGVENTPQISYSSTSVLLSDKTVYHSFFRTIPSDTYQAQALADLLKQFGWTYVSIVASDNAYGRAGLDSLRSELKKKDICIALEEVFNPLLPQNELRRIIKSLKSKPRVRVIILWCERPNALGFLNEASRKRLKGKTWIGTETWGDAWQLESLDKNVVGGMLGVLPLLKKHTAYEEHLKSLHPNNTDHNPWMWEYWTSKFNCSWVTGVLMNSTYDRIGVGEKEAYVYKTKDPNVTIICPKDPQAGPPTGDLLPRNKYTNVMDAVYAVAHAVKNILDCKDRNSLLLDTREQCPSIDAIKPSDILKFLKNVSFEGRSGSQIMFDEKGDLRYGSYAIKNLQRYGNDKMKFVEIGTWNGIDGKLSLSKNSKIMWNGWNAEQPISTCSDECRAGHYPVEESVRCCWKCVECENDFVKPNAGQEKCMKCPKEYVSNTLRTKCVKLKSDFLAWGNGEGVSAAVLAVVGAFISVGVLAVFYKYRNTAVVKASNRELSFVHLGCIVAIFVLPFVMIGKPTVAGCTAFPFFFGIPLTLCTSIMLLKTDRLLRIFQARSRLTASSSYLISNKTQVIVAVIMTLVPVIMTMIWLIVDSPHVVTKVDTSREGWQIISCDKSHELLNIIILAYVLIIALLCTYFAFKARKLPENFNEAKFICFAMFAFCIFWLSFFPAYYDSTGSTRNFVFCLGILSSSYAVLCIMYAPKLRVILFHPENNTTEAFRATTMVAMKKAGVVVSSNSATPPRMTPVPSPVPSRRNSPDLVVANEGRNSAVSIGRTILPSLSQLGRN